MTQCSRCVLTWSTLYSRAVVGWAMRHRMQQALVNAALETAVARRQPQAEVLLHSDRGSQLFATLCSLVLNAGKNM
ncbi:TPA: DDE-type integrase/transposase/recombinase [Pseudomonas aeruginosa]|uniref:DDE-type integrase/transposase/recombinase n=1 Tax=Pseudomonas aeruginosa TaxID=287 RepID=UPI000F52BBA5|nr:DDE-type integrase/transposase/recombinase [Pseudomonas sp.]RPW03466.1 hypothetical protein IPC775_26450 [Pseudomonas aeruginosa]HEJ2990133.1 DDE-type integrase/transposase/recombinase [Pseudomonas aeruginosa]